MDEGVASANEKNFMKENSNFEILGGKIQAPLTMVELGF